MSLAQLVQQLRDILGDHCGFSVEFHPLQAARGLVTTPYPMCAMLLGIRLGASAAAVPPACCRVPRCPCRTLHVGELLGSTTVSSCACACHVPPVTPRATPKIGLRQTCCDVHVCDLATSNLTQLSAAQSR